MNDNMENLHSDEMDVDPEPAENPMLNHVILARVFNNLETLDLVNCSGVNKLWFREGRKVLKNRRCHARCGGSRPCMYLRRLDRFLKKLDPDEIWYNGLYISVDSYTHRNETTETACLKKYDDTTECFKPKNIPYNNILTKLPLKYLKINWYRSQKLPNCPGALLIPKLLLHHGETMEEIELVDGPFWLDDWLYDSKDLQNGELWLPKLKLMKGKPLEDRAFSPEAIWKLIHVAPILEDLSVCVTSNDLRKGLVPSDRYNIIKSLLFECRTNFDVRAYNKFASTEPRLRCLVVKYTFDDDMNLNEDSSSDDSSFNDDDDLDNDDLGMDSCWEVFDLLLKSSRESLEMMRLPVLVLVRQFGSDWQVFPNVKELSLEIPLKQHAEELFIHELLRRFDFRTSFPNLTSVTLFDNKREREDELEDDDDDFENSVHHQPMLPLVYSAKIRRLTLKNFVTDFGLAYSASVFAHVTELDLSISGSGVLLRFGTIWREFPQLEVLSVGEGFWDKRSSYDSEFLGVSKAEARRLQHEGLEDLKKLHIVPTKPCITTTKNLRQVTVNFMENRLYDGRTQNECFLSPAACILTVQRMPGLKFKLICSHLHKGVMALRDYVDIENR